MVPQNTTCSTCAESNHFQNKTNQTCHVCSDSCSKCESAISCQTCNNGYYLNSNKKCIIKNSIGISFEAVSNPFLFMFTFDNSWPELFEMFKNRSTSQLTIWLENNKTLNYTFSLTKGIKNNSYYIRLEYLNPFPEINKLNVQFGYPSDEKFSRFIMNQTYHTLPLREIVNCSEFYYYNYSNLN